MGVGSVPVNDELIGYMLEITPELNMWLLEVFSISIGSLKGI